MSQDTILAHIMSSTAGLSEDVWQLPYLCSINMAKVVKAIGADEVEWNHDLLEYCDRSIEDRVVSEFAARLKVRLQELNDQTGA